jgi:signal transduction histidine kinase
MGIPLRLPHRTARLRLAAIYGALSVVTGAALAAITYALFERATAYSKPAIPKIPAGLAGADLKLPTFGNLAQRLMQDQYQLTQAQNQLTKPVYGVPGAPPNPIAGGIKQQLTQDQHQLTQDQHQLTRSLQQLTQSAHQLAQAGAAQAAQRAADAHQLLVNSGIALAIVALLTIVAGWLVAGRLLRPIRTITRTARRISSTSLHERLALGGPQDELKELGDTLDGLFGRLEAAFEAQRHFVANASHELRTPVTAERALLQVALDDPGTSSDEWRSTAMEVLASSDEQARLIEALLTLATSESGLNDREPVDLAPAVSASLAALAPETRGLSIEAFTDSAPLDGDAVLVERLVANLLANAIRHNAPGGQVEVRTGISDGAAFLSVSNTGPVIPAADLDRLFQPFQRLSRRRANYKDGHGLGLSIVRAIATAHGATVAARPLPDGGLRITVRFPPSASPAIQAPPQPGSRLSETSTNLPQSK